MRTVKLLTVTSSSSAIVWFISASAVALDVLLECLLICGVECRIGEGTRVAGPASVSLYLSKRAPDTDSYGWKRRVLIGPVLLKPVPG